MDPETGKIMEYRQLIKKMAYAKIWGPSFWKNRVPDPSLRQVWRHK